MGGHRWVKAAPSTPLTYVFSSMHLSAKRSPGRRSAPQAGPPPPPHLSLTPRPWRASRLTLKLLTAAHHPAPWPCSSKQGGGPVPPGAQSRLPAPGRPWALRLRGARAEPRALVPVSPRAHPPLGLAPHRAGDLCILGADPGPGTQWVRGEPGEGVFQAKITVWRTGRPHFGGRVPVSGRSAGGTPGLSHPRIRRPCVCL